MGVHGHITKAKILDAQSPYFVYSWPKYWLHKFFVQGGQTSSGLLKVIFLAVAEAKGEGGKTSALEVEAEGEAEGLVFCV